MSATIPLTLIEGAMALPRLRPLAHLPGPFGREWTFRPSYLVSLRTELRALYAAVLRSFSLDAARIRSMCRWEPLRERPAAGAFAAMPPVSDAPVGGLVAKPAESGSFGTPYAQRLAAAPSGASMRWGRLAGGACAIGGAAILAWVTFGDSPQRDAPSGAENPHRVPTIRDERATNQKHAAKPADRVPAQVLSGLQGPTLATPDNITKQAEVTRPHGDESKAPAKRAATLAAPPRLTRDVNRASRQDTLQTARHTAPNTSRRTGNLPARHNRFISEESSWIAPPVIAHGSSPTHSAAGSYSPLAPSLPGNNEYASITTSAATQLRGHAVTSRSTPSINTGSTDWMNSLSQCRVTDVPERFSK